MTKKKRGRPRLPEGAHKTKCVNIRFTPIEYKQLTTLLCSINARPYAPFLEKLVKFHFSLLSPDEEAAFIQQYGEHIDLTRKCVE